MLYYTLAFQCLVQHKRLVKRLDTTFAFTVFLTHFILPIYIVIQDIKTMSEHIWNMYFTKKKGSDSKDFHILDDLEHPPRTQTIYV